MILLTGGTGVIGRKLIKRLKRRGVRIRLFTLPGDPNLPDVRAMVDDVRIGTISKMENVSGICEGVDKVYHLASVIVTNQPSLFQSVNVEGTRNLVDEAVRCGVGHFIYISSASVVYPKPTLYSLSKRSGESLVVSSGLQHTIVRPTLVYDKGRGGVEFDMFLSYLRRFPVIPFIGNGEVKKRPVFVEDLVDGLAEIDRRVRGVGGVYNLSGGASISLMELSRLCLNLFQTPSKPVLQLPVSLCKGMAYLLERIWNNSPLNWQVIAGMTQDADLDPACAISDLGYSPKSVHEALPLCFPRC